MKIEYKPKSLADQVFEELEEKILTGEYEQGESLSEKKLSAELGVSRTPIREALSKLAYENLVEETSSGTVVRGISKEDVEDIFEVKRRLEIVATKRAAKNMDDEDLEKLREVLDQQQYYAGKGDAIKVRNLDTEFHDLIYAGSGSLILGVILTRVHQKLMKYRKSSLEHEGRIMASVAEHEAIYNAIKSRNAKEVERLMSTHIDNVYKSINEE